MHQALPLLLVFTLSLITTSCDTFEEKAVDRESIYGAWYLAESVGGFAGGRYPHDTKANGHIWQVYKPDQTFVFLNSDILYTSGTYTFSFSDERWILHLTHNAQCTQTFQINFPDAKTLVAGFYPVQPDALGSVFKHSSTLLD